jgi:hypothetical protein
MTSMAQPMQRRLVDRSLMTSASTAHALHASPATPVALGTAEAPSRVTTVLLVCGILSSLVYVAADVLGALRWEGYSSASQAISELSAIDAPSRSVWVPLGMAYDVLLVAFGVGVWRCAGRKRSLRGTAALLIAIAVIGSFWPPMHLRGIATTLTDTLHVVFASIISLLILLAIGVGATAFGKRFRIYSIATLVALLIFGSLAFLYAPALAANLPTPWIGVYERINLGGYLLWVAVLASALLRRKTGEHAALGTPGPIWKR